MRPNVSEVGIFVLYGYKVNLLDFGQFKFAVTGVSFISSVAHECILFVFWPIDEVF